MKTTTTYRQKDNGWQIIVSWKDENGRWRQKSKQGFPHKRDAKEAEAGIIAAIKKQPHPVDEALRGITLKQFVEEYLRARKGLIHGSKKHYINAVNALQDLAKRPVDTITFRDLQNVISGWNYASETQKNYRILLRALFRAAVKPYRLISENPMDDVEIAKGREKKERRPVTDEEYKKVLAALKDDPEALLAVNILYYTGLRRGELLGLTWDKIDWKGSSMIIETQWNNTVTGRHQLQPPKSSNGFRVIPIPAKLLTMLRQYYNKYPLQMDRRLFVYPGVMIRRVCGNMRLVHPDISPHCLRHTYATNLLARGIDVQTVAALIGDDPETVIRTYIHYTDKMREAAKTNIEKIFA